jgi:hypothetical protein
VKSYLSGQAHSISEMARKRRNVQREKARINSLGCIARLATLDDALMPARLASPTRVFVLWEIASHLNRKGFRGQDRKYDEVTCECHTDEKATILNGR